MPSDSIRGRTSVRVTKTRQDKKGSKKGSPGAAQADVREVRPDMKAPPGFPPGRGFSCFSSLRATGSRERALDERLREAIHLTACGGMDCFVAEAPRNDGMRLMIKISNSYDSAFPRRNAPEVCIDLTLLKKQRAQGKPGARCTRGLVCKMHKEMRTRAYRFSGGIRHPLRDGFTAYAALSPATNSSCHRRRRI